jgi:hypothetical protein
LDSFTALALLSLTAFFSSKWSEFLLEIVLLLCPLLTGAPYLL